MAEAETGPRFELVPLAPAALVAAREQITRAAADHQVQEYSVALAGFCRCDEADPLAEYERIALLGVCAGFVERQLSPYVAEHIAIIPPMLEEIRAVFRELATLGTAYDSAEFRIRAFHYGVHKASYLDWRLYLSKECY